MKILIAPDNYHPGSNASVLLAQNLIDLLRSGGHQVLVSAAQTCHLQNAAFFRAPVPHRRKLFYDAQDLKTYESYMYATGAAGMRYLEKDYQSVGTVISQENPDLVISLGRIAAVACARNHHIPCWCTIHAAMYREKSFDSATLKDVNIFLRNHGLEQVLHLADLFQYVDRRIAFGPDEYQPFLPENGIVRLGLQSVPPLTPTVRDHVSVIFGKMNLSPSRLKKIVLECFEGAPYQVRVYIDGIHSSSSGNVRFIREMRHSVLPGSKICIHDGNDYVTNQCIAYGIPQIIIHDQSYLRSWNAAALMRSRAGLTIHEKMLTMEALYETYRTVASDDSFTETAIAQSESLCRKGDLYTLIEPL